MELKYILTRKDAEAFLRDKGLEGVALEAMLKESGRERHQLRVYAALKAADKFVKNWKSGLSCGEEKAYSCALLWADYAGIGGIAGVSGASTRRHPGMDTLGKGRKQATDGGAWSAAILAAALQRSSKDCGFFPSTDGGSLLFQHFGCLDVDLSTFILPQWQYTICREGLRRSLGLQRWFRHLPILPQFPPELWGKLCNAIQSQLSIDKPKAPADVEAPA